jgi:hypothetical protein
VTRVFEKSTDVTVLREPQLEEQLAKSVQQMRSR